MKGFGAEFIDALKVSNTCHTLDLSGAYFTKTDWTHVFSQFHECLRVETLIIDGTRQPILPLKDALLKQFVISNSTLKLLKLRKLQFTDEEFIPFCDGLKYNQILTDLELDQLKLSPSSFESLTKALKENTSIINLCLKGEHPVRGQPLPDTLMSVFFEGMAEVKTVEQLVLRYFPFSINNVKSISKFLEEGDSVEMLQIMNTDLKSFDNEPSDYLHFLEEFMKGMAKNRSIRTLYISDFPFSIVEDPKFGRLLQGNQTLEKLVIGKVQHGRIHGGKMDSTLFGIVAEMLNFNPSLKQLELNASVGEEGFRSFCDALTTNKSLDQIRLKCNILD